MATTKQRWERLLTKDDFKKYPEWSRQMFAYRLMNMIIPASITKELNKHFKTAQIHPQINLPQNINIPPGVIITPGQVFPPGWSTGDPLPPNVTLLPGTSMPPSWTPADPLPPNVIITPSPSDVITIISEPVAEPPVPGSPTAPPVSPIPDTPTSPIIIALPPVIVISPETPSVSPPSYVQIFEPGPISIGTNKTPIEVSWRNYTNENYWEQTDSSFFWNGAAWEKSASFGASAIKVKTGSTWATDLAPIALYLKYSGPTTGFTLEDNYGGWPFGQSVLIPSKTIKYFTIASNRDIKYLRIDQPTSVVQITEIKFLA